MMNAEVPLIMTNLALWSYCHHELIPVITIIFYWLEMSTLDFVGVVATLVWRVKIKSTVCLHHVVALTSTGSPSLVCVGKYLIYYEMDP